MLGSAAVFVKQPVFIHGAKARDTAKVHCLGATHMLPQPRR